MEAASRPATLLQRRPPDLIGLVDQIVSYRENGQGLDHFAEAASLVVPLVISFGEPFEIALGRSPTSEDRYANFTSGLYPGHVQMNSSGAAECVQVNFTPMGARIFFGLPMNEISGVMVRIEDVADREIDALRARLGEERNWDRRLDMAEEFVRNRLRCGAGPTAPVQWAYEAILGAHGVVRVGKLAEALDWSRKHLVRRFHEEVGIGPKAVARMVRFNRALALARIEKDPDWADIAALCGYADQAHLIRDFRVLAGETPAVWQRRAT